MSCALSASTVFFYIFNVTLGLIGLTSFGIGTYGAVNGTFGETSQNIVMIVTGIIIIAIFILGCIGVQRKSTCLLWIYATIVGLLFILQLVSLIRLYTQNIRESASAILQTSWNFRNINPTTMSMFERNYYCCGFHGYEDYLAYNETIPISCYQIGHYEEVAYRHNIGCSEFMKDISEFGDPMIKSGSWIAIIIEGGALTFSILLASSFRQKQTPAHVIYKRHL